MRAVMVVLIAAGFSLNGWGANAQDAARRELAEQLLNEMDMKGTVEKSFALMKKMMPAQMDAMKPAKATADAAVIPSTKQTTKAMNKMFDSMAQEMSWDKLKDDYITI